MIINRKDWRNKMKALIIGIVLGVVAINVLFVYCACVVAAEADRKLGFK